MVLIIPIGVTPTVFFDPTSYYVNESDGIATIIVTTDVPGGPQDGAVEFYTEDDSATGPLIFPLPLL